MLSEAAMLFGLEKHKNQTRRYTGDQYAVHCAEVVGVLVPILLAAGYDAYIIDRAVAIAWLHDVIEDCGVTRQELRAKFGAVVEIGVSLLTDPDKDAGNREERKRMTRIRLGESTAIIQTIKCCDGWSNAVSIKVHDPDFFGTFSREFDKLLVAMDKSLPTAVDLVRSVIGHPNEPKEYEVWMEGWMATGEINQAQLLGKVIAHSFKEAKLLVYNKQTPAEQRHWNKEKTSVWGCKLYRTEAEARKFCG